MEREIIGSRAFNIENERIYTDEAMRKDIISYLSEYRLRIQEFDYELLFSYKEGEGYKIRDIYQGEAMSVKAKRTLLERRSKGLPIHRELAEDAGIESLDEQLPYAQGGDRIFWFSPPGPREEGYGNYGFLYAGHITRVTGWEKNITMTAIRIEHPTLGRSNDALSTLTGRRLEYTSAEDFLANPYVKQGGDLSDVDFTLYQFFSFTMDEKEGKINKQVIAAMDSMIDEFIVVIKTGTREEKIQSFHALENYAIELKARYKRKRDDRDEQIVYSADYHDYQYLAGIISIYGFKPPVVAGSCGSTDDNESKSNDIFADNFKELMKAIFGDFKKFGIGESAEDDPNLCRCNNQKAHFHCPGKDGKPCNHPIIVGKGTATCPSCGKGKVC